MLPTPLRWPLLLVFAGAVCAQFRAESNLRSVAAQVKDARGNSLTGLRVEDFTLLEDGIPQKVAFFDANRPPISLAVLLDSSRSMTFGGKFQRAHALLAPLLRGNREGDEIFLVPFTDRVEQFRRLTGEERLHPPLPDKPAPQTGTSFYDALATTLCQMKFAQNRRQAIVVVAGLAQTSSAQIFTVGFFEKSEFESFRRSTNTIALQGEREIDNPLLVFERLAKETGAEAFFPTSDGDLKHVIDRISSILEAQYTLAYYPANIDRFRRIEVKVNRPGARVTARRGLGPDEDAEPVHFVAGSCAVSRQDHPYPWEPRLTVNPSGLTEWRDDFTDIHSGWPTRPDDHSFERAAFRYIPHGYEITFHKPSHMSAAAPLKGDVVAYGPVWGDFRASVLVESDWDLPVTADSAWQIEFRPGVYRIAAGMVFHMGPEGYYAFLLTGAPTHRAKLKSAEKQHMRFALLRRTWGGQQTELIPWTDIPPPEAPFGVLPPPVPREHKIAAEDKGGEIALFVDDREVGLQEKNFTTIRRAKDTTYGDGLTGFALFGDGSALYHDLIVEGPQ